MFRQIFLITELIVSIVSLLGGLILILKPEDAIKAQENFYKKLNWKIEPLDYNKEIRNTRIIGGIGIACAVALLVILLIMF